MIVMRHPLERFLSKKTCIYHGIVGDHPPEDDNGTQAQLWWNLANAKCADNYALGVLGPHRNCKNGTDTGIDCLEGAKALLRRFTFVIDKACLDESLVELGRQLHLDVEGAPPAKIGGGKHAHDPLTPRERMQNDTLYEYLEDKFRRDIELYEWSKTQSIVQCNVTNE
jgi:hypothetical protein